ncbi:hypothetical protein M422DRAFT_25553 [Sphaerobolus stellatus SS14]|nr:hypothetical protein M422DRAFT_25553 [Sphaerobolus stellatus SS14]
MYPNATPPTSSLPPLKNIAQYPRSTITAALMNLRVVYWPSSVIHINNKDIGAALGPGRATMHAVKEERVPDSGYASAEEDEEEEEERMELLRADAMERAYALRWLTGFIARFEEWVDAAATSEPALEEEEYAARGRILEEAVALLALSADTTADGEISRAFAFKVGGGEVAVELKDEPYAADHESVGLQTWGSASVLAERICGDPETYLRINAQGKDATLRVLELGAGTGLLSLVVGKLAAHPVIKERGVKVEVLATDYHPAVLENLRGNVARNFALTEGVVQVEKLDWVDPPALAEADKFDVILAADVIYDKRHGAWIKACAERVVRRSPSSVMWMIVPRRPTRTGEVEGVDDVFLPNGLDSLAILKDSNVARNAGVGRADEDGYRLFEIGWNIMQ